MFKPNYRLTNAIINHITAITEAREEVLRSPILPKVENRLRHDALVSRSHHSTSIEGNPLNLLEVQVIVDGGDLVARPKDKQEIKNYRDALKSIEKSAKQKRVPAATILKIQHLIAKKVLPKNDCGKYRNRMVYVVNSFGQTVFTPPPAKAVPKLVADLIKWLNHPNSLELHPVLVAGIAHYELVRIHPFIDGNGRTARALATLILYQRNFDIKHFFALDDYYNENRDAYYTALRYVDPQTRDLTQWLEYFVEGVASQMKKLKDKVNNLSLNPVLRNLKARVTLRERQWKALEYIQTHRQITNQEYQRVIGTSRESAKRDLASMVKAGILRKSGKGRSAYYEII
jgi:Fic family protein